MSSHVTLISMSSRSFVIIYFGDGSGSLVPIVVFVGLSINKLLEYRMNGGIPPHHQIKFQNL